MFLGKLHRKKRKLLLCPVHSTPKAPPMSWSRPAHDAAGIERKWYDCVWSSHAACCGCGDPVSHLNRLAARLGRPAPPGPPPTPRQQSVRPLPALPAPETWPGAAAGGGAAGDAAGDRGGAAGDEGDVADADLIDAVDLAE